MTQICLSKLKFLIITVICIGFFVGCSSQDKSAEVNKITVWHWMTDRQDAFNELAKNYQDSTGVEVEFKLFFPPDIYAQKVIAAARAGNLPDVFGILGEKKTLASFAKAGYLVDFTSAMEENASAWKNSFYPQTLATSIFKQKNYYGAPAGIYGVPIDMTVLQFIYNKSLFKKAGLPIDSPPKTFDELISYAKKAKSKLGVEGFICGWGESWLLNALATEWAINIMGEEKFINTIKGDVSYVDSDWLEVFNAFKTLKDSGILIQNIDTVINKESEDMFAREKALFSFNGSWSVNVYSQLNPDLDYAFFSLPQMSDKYPVKIWGGAGASLMVNSKSAQKTKAIDFLRWITEENQQKFLVEETNNLAAIKGCDDYLSDVLKGLMNTFSGFTHPNVWPYNEDSQVLEKINKGLQDIVRGLRSPAEVANEVQQEKERSSR